MHQPGFVSDAAGLDAEAECIGHGDGVGGFRDRGVEQHGVIAELERFRKTVAEGRLALKEVRKNLRQDAEALVFWTKLANIALMPLLVALFGLGFAFYRRKAI